MPTPKDYHHRRPQKIALKNGRPPLVQTTTTVTSNSRKVISSRVTRTIIRSHHRLRKQLARARSDGDVAEVNRIEAAIEDQGGLKAYQDASRWGQAADRGGDSSRVLVEWLKEEDVDHDWIPGGGNEGGSEVIVERAGTLENWNGGSGDDDDDNEDDKGSNYQSDNYDQECSRRKKRRRREYETSSGLQTTASPSSDAERKPPQPATSKHLSNPSLDHGFSLSDIRPTRSLRILEIGSLDPNNAISHFPDVTMHRIDLKSENSQIQEMDFMDLPVPDSIEKKFDIVSLSLVVNFVDEAAQRGEMLKRTTLFLRRWKEEKLDEVSREGFNSIGSLDKKRESDNDHDKNEKDWEGFEDDTDIRLIDTKSHTSALATPKDTIPSGKSPPPPPPSSLSNPILPALFFVLPLPCVSNSRYLTEDRLEGMMTALGYKLTKVKRSKKLYYSLWTLSPKTSGEESPGLAAEVRKRDGRNRRVKAEYTGHDVAMTRKVFRKEEVRSGKDRNNFAIVLEV